MKCVVLFTLKIHEYKIAKAVIMLMCTKKNRSSRFFQYKLIMRISIQDKRYILKYGNNPALIIFFQRTGLLAILTGG